MMPFMTVEGSGLNSKRSPGLRCLRESIRASWVGKHVFLRGHLGLKVVVFAVPIGVQDH